MRELKINGIEFSGFGEDIRSYKHSNKDRLCYNCDEVKEEDIITLSFTRPRGYGSLFNGMKVSICICKDCLEKLHIQEYWFDNKKAEKYSTEKECIYYEGEEELLDILNSFIPENSEYIFNQGRTKIDRQDWIRDNMCNDNYTEIYKNKRPS